MNEQEQKLWSKLSDEEQKYVAGGEDVHADKPLTKEQCDKLKGLPHYPVMFPEPLLCKYGGPGMFKPKVPIIQKEPQDIPKPEGTVTTETMGVQQDNIES